MPAKKQSKKQEPLLNAVARKLGHAAGKLTKATQELTENLSGRSRKPLRLGCARPTSYQPSLHGLVLNLPRKGFAMPVGCGGRK